MNHIFVFFLLAPLLQSLRLCCCCDFSLQGCRPNWELNQWHGTHTTFWGLYTTHMQTYSIARGVKDVQTAQSRKTIVTRTQKVSFPLKPEQQPVLGQISLPLLAIVSCFCFYSTNPMQYILTL